MLILRTTGDTLSAHAIVVCDKCGIEIDIIRMCEYENICEKNGWTKKSEYDINAAFNEKYKLFHWCPKCSLEHANKLQGEKLNECETV